MGPTSDFALPIAKPAKKGPEHLPHYWHPGRAGVRKAPEWFLGRLKSEMGDELEVTWNPLLERWQVWSKAPRIQNPICQGWRLLFIHNGPSGGYAALDERIAARLYSASADQWGSGKAYFDHIKAEMERDRERYERQATADAIDAAMPSFDHSQISVSMAGQSNGSKFSTYHA